MVRRTPVIKLLSMTLTLAKKQRLSRKFWKLMKLHMHQTLQRWRLPMRFALKNNSWRILEARKPAGWKLQDKIYAKCH
ncbi:hypothetical protein JG687_00015597 [Phytophthora cactorum]|uniref:Uncharacterized protein n=1 Tax=Phytophthora cactorum TaxID=29920 RepID=A0A8T1TXJ0_9STRA|nr:hypothetical protein JG687_00015597 [Phytophthora cactorum]